MPAQDHLTNILWIAASLALLAVLAGGLYLLLRFFKNRRVAQELEAGASSRVQEVEGIIIHYHQIGEGPDLVLLHGIGANVYTWRLLVPLLAHHFRLTLIDIPGFGRSSKRPERDHGLDEQSRIIVKFCNLVGIGKMHLVGSSMGGAIALWIAKQNPERVQKVVVLAPAVSPKLLPLELTRLAKLILPTTNILVSRPLVRKLLERVLTRKELISEEVVLHYQRPYLEDGKTIQTFIKATSVVSDSRLPAELRAVRTPTLILYGRKDRLVPKRVMDELLQVLPNVSYQENESAGHHPQEDEPEWVADCIRTFLLAP